MKIFLLIFTLVGMLVTSAYARNNTDNSAGLDVGMYNFNNTLFGFNAFAKFGIADNIKIGANIGYYFKSNSSGLIKTTSYVMPITGLFEYHFLDNDFSPYAGVDAGFYRSGTTGFIKVSTMKFGITPTVGFDYKLTGTLSINANLKYHYVLVQGNNGALGLNAGIEFGF